MSIQPYQGRLFTAVADRAGVALPKVARILAALAEIWIGAVFLAFLFIRIFGSQLFHRLLHLVLGR